jgi:predicted phosphohydrolase
MRSLLAVLELALGRAASVVHDHVVHASDLCCGGDLAELEVAADWIARLPHRHKVIVAGNHDWAFVHEPARARMLFATAHYLKDAEVMIDGVRFYGSPWQPAFHDWAFNLPRGAALAAVWAKIPRGVDVLITHGPPNGIGDRTTMVARAGCVDLRRRVAELAPALHLFGHTTRTAARGAMARRRSPTSRRGSASDRRPCSISKAAWSRRR